MMSSSPTVPERVRRTADTPAGWSYNPSAWRRRASIVALSALGFTVAAYLAAAQAGWFAALWDPLFTRPSAHLLHSWASRGLYVSDVGLGVMIAASYVAVAITACMGGSKRFRTAPWTVMLFGVAVWPLGMAALAWTLLQPVLFDAWCTLRLVTAFVTLALMTVAADEILASFQYLRREAARDRTIWQALWGRGEPKPHKPAREVRHVGAL
jgi:hypothetical protein